MKRPSLIDDWRYVLRRAWSIRLILIAGLLSGCETVLAAFGHEWLPLPRWASALLVTTVVMGALVARLLAQRKPERETSESDKEAGRAWAERMRNGTTD